MSKLFQIPEHFSIELRLTHNLLSRLGLQAGPRTSGSPLTRSRSFVVRLKNWAGSFLVKKREEPRDP